MKVAYSHDEGIFTFSAGDYVTVVVRYLYVEDTEDEIYYHGTLKTIEKEGFSCVLDKLNQEQYFRFSQIESVLPGDRIPFLIGSAKRLNRGE